MYRIFSEKLRQLRKQNGYTLDALSRVYNDKYDAHLNKSTLCRYESGAQHPSVTVAKNLADLFHVSVDDLTGEKRPSVSEKIRALCESMNKSLEDVARILDIPYGTTVKLRDGTGQVTLDQAQKLASYFHVPVSLFLPPPSFSSADSNIMPVLPDTSLHKRIPVLGKIPAGIPVEAIEDVLDYVELTDRMVNSDYEYFALLITGNSMYPEYLDGDVIIVRKQSTADSGDDVVAYIGGSDATLKRLVITPYGISLRPLNPTFETRTFTNRQVFDLPVTIGGVVVEQRRQKHRK